MMWGKLVCLVALLPLANGWSLMDCLGMEALEKLPPTVQEPARQLERLLVEHEFLRFPNRQHPADSEELQLCRQLNSHLQEILERTVQSLPNDPAPREVSNLPSALRLLVGLFDVLIQPLRTERWQVLLHWCDSQLFGPTSGPLYIFVKKLNFQRNSLAQTARGVLEYWLNSPRPLWPPEESWLSPYLELTAKVLPLQALVYADSAEMESYIGDMEPQECFQLEQELHTAIDSIGPAFCGLQRHRLYAQREFANGCGHWLQVREPAIPDCIYIATCKQAKPMLRVGQLLNQLHALYMVQMVCLKLSIPEMDLEYTQLHPSVIGSLKEDYSELQDAVRLLGILLGQITEVYGKIVECTRQYPGDFAKLLEVIVNPGGSFTRFRPVINILPRLWRHLQGYGRDKDLPEELKGSMQELWTKSVEVIRKVDSVLELAIGQNEEQKRHELLLHLLSKHTCYALESLIVWVGKFMHIALGRIEVPQGYEYSWREESPIVMLAQTMWPEGLSMKRAEDKPMGPRMNKTDDDEEHRQRDGDSECAN